MSVTDSVRRLRRLDACAVSDAIDQLGLPPEQAGVVDGLSSPRPAEPVAGRVVTVELGPSSAASSGRHLATAAIDASGPGDVIVVAHRGRLDCAGWGGNLSRGALARGLRGVVVDGAVRDVDEAHSLGFAIYCVGVTPRTARGRAVEVSWGNLVEVRGRAVATGDFVLADATGVVFIRQAVIEDVLAAAEAIAEREALMAADISAGLPLGTVMGTDYETMLSGDGR